MDKDRDEHRPPVGRTSKGRAFAHHSLTAGLATSLVVGTLMTATAVTATSPAAADGSTLYRVAATTITPGTVSGRIRAADRLSADLARSGAAVAVSRQRLRDLFEESEPLQASFTATRAAQEAAQRDATNQSARLVELARQVQLTRIALNRSAIDSYIDGGGPLGEMALPLESLDEPTHGDDDGDDHEHDRPSEASDALSTQRYRKARSAWFDQGVASSKATSASTSATAAANASARAKSAHDSIVARQQRVSAGLNAVEDAQVSRAAGLRSRLLRSGTPADRAADVRLARTLNGRDYALLMRQSATCGIGSPIHHNGRWPGASRCPLYAAPGQTLRRTAALAFDRMSEAYQQRTGSALCVNESYRSYTAQVAIKASFPGLAAIPGTSKHGLGLALDLCGGVQDFKDPAHQWLKANGPRFGWVHPKWAEPSGSLPEPWHWEFVR